MATIWLELPPRGGGPCCAHLTDVFHFLPLCRFRIEDESRTGIVSSPLLAWACIRLDRLRLGYRFVRLMDVRSNPVPGGKLLVKVSKTMR
ncbi:hypothetical protein TOPH_05472 [Tolypocladium ophioglossoides CBS 100239]|uniref:Uncharacterized protein n=1 Tax=Tolypocladium ophioglossoides (strain CBS 100239) TaxID=1163406 RepID=A0A0L0N7A6_TOLOC|nr:hypothetical protein TOPH_05472 [Tolypocladium ophioglossoides CBS 100239]